mmetsp:Transcript_20148/g.33284  ORF Transcript_20148/g.33284 Transcript_20148/m.33284 type:complete len:248 (+) Transcript_20148:67-810(+)
MQEAEPSHEYNDTYQNPQSEQPCMYEETACRVCLTAEPEHDLIAPCLCSGTSKWVHRVCLDLWRRSSVVSGAVSSCTTCGFTFELETSPSWLKWWFVLDFVAVGLLVSHFVALLEGGGGMFLYVYLCVLEVCCICVGVFVYPCLVASWLESFKMPYKFEDLDEWLFVLIHMLACIELLFSSSFGGVIACSLLVVRSILTASGFLSLFLQLLYFRQSVRNDMFCRTVDSVARVKCLVSDDCLGKKNKI